MKWTEEPQVIQLKQDRTQNKHHQQKESTPSLPSHFWWQELISLFLFLGLRVDLWFSHTYEVNLNSVLLRRRQLAPLSHSHRDTALPSAPSLALLYSCLLEVVLTSWNITGQWQSKCKRRHNLMRTTLHRGWISYFNGNELLDLLLFSVSFEWYLLELPFQNLYNSRASSSILPVKRTSASFQALPLSVFVFTPLSHVAS